MYKVSKYNHFVKYNNKYICFNALSGALFELSDKMYTFYLKNINDIGKISDENSIFFDNLRKMRIVLHNQDEELNIIRMRHNKGIYLNNNYDLIINPTMDCNFKCWYCYEKHHKSKISEEMLDRIYKYMEKLIKSRKIRGINLSWFGGEPLIFFNSIIYPFSNRIYKYMEKLIKSRKIRGINLSWFGGEPLIFFNSIIYPFSKRIKKMCAENASFFSNSITTNGYLINKNMIENINEINLNSFQITLDGNKENHDKSRILKNGDKTFDKIISNIHTLCNNINDARIILRINYNKDTLLSLDKVINEFSPEIRKCITVDFQRIWQTYDNKNNSLNELLIKTWELFSKNGFKTMAKGSINVTHKCYADKWFQAVINYDGNVYKCTARDFNLENRCGYLNKNNEIVWDVNKISKRFQKASFENEKCLNCKMLPLCMGTCSQKQYENIDDRNMVCDLFTDDYTIDKFIVDRYNKLLRDKLTQVRQHLIISKI